MTEAASVVLKVDATSVDKGAVSLDQLTAASAKTDKATAQLNEQQRRAAEAMKSTATATATTQNTTTQYIAALEKLIASHDKGATASQAYDNAVRGATKAQKDHIDALIQSTQVHQQSASAVDMLSTAVKALGLSYAAYKVGQYMSEAAILNAKYELLGVTMAQVGKNVGYTAAQMDMAAEAMQREGINLMASREAAIKMVQAHIDLANASKLAKLAQDAAIIGNINAEEALLRLTQGIMVGRTQTLKLMGLNVDFELGYRQMADTLHKTTAELSENEKTQSRLNQVLLKGTEIAGANEAAMGTAAKQMILMKSYAEDLKVQLGGVFNEVLTVAVLALTKGLEDANGEVTALARNGQLKQWGEGLVETFVFVADNINNLIGAVRIMAASVSLTLDVLGTKAFDFEGRKAIYAKFNTDLDGILAGEDRFTKGMMAHRAAQQADAAKAQAAERANLDQYIRIITYWGQQRDKHLMSEKAYAQGLRDLQKQMYGQGTPTFPDDKPPPKTPTGGSKTTSEYERLSDAMEKVTQQAEDEAAANGKLSESDRYLSGQLANLERAYANGKITMEEWSKLYDKAIDTTAAKAHVEDLKAAAKAAEEVAKTQIKAENDIQESKIKSADAIGKQATEMEAANTKLIAEIEMIGKSKEQQDLLTAARLESVIALKEEEVAGLKNNEFLSKRQILLEDEIKALKERQKLLTQKAVVEQQADQTKAQLDSQVSMWRSIDSAAQQTFVNVFEGGKNAFDKLKETLKSGLLALLYEMTVKKWIFQIFANVTGGGSALSQAAGMVGSTSGGGVLGLASDASTLYSAASGTGIAGSVGTGVGALFGATAGNTALGTTLGLGYSSSLAAATAATEAGAAAGATAATGALGAIPVYGWVALAGIALYSIFGGKGGGPKSEAGYAPNGMDISGLDIGGNAQGSQRGDVAAATTLSQGISGSYATLAQQLGLVNTKLDVGLFYAQDKEGTSQTQLQMVGGTYNRSKLTGGIENVGRGDQALQDAIALATSQLILTNLQSSGLKGKIGDFINSLSVTGMTSAEINAALTKAGNAGVVEQYGAAMKNLAGLSVEAGDGLVTAAGGLAKFTPMLDAYYAAFYNDGERAAAATNALDAQFKALGVSTPASKDAFRSLVDAQDLNTAAGQSMAAALYALAPAFDAAASAAAAARQQMASALQNYGTSAEQRNFTVDTIQQSLAQAGLNLTHDQIANASRADARALYEQQVAAGNTRGADAILANQAAFAGITSNPYETSSYSGGGGGGGSTASASNPALTAWQSATDAIVQTMKDLRQTLIGSGPDSFSKLMAQFVTETAAAKAGSLAAAQDLPTAAKALAQAGEANSRTRVEQQRLTAYIINTLGSVAASQGAALPSFATGTSYIPKDMTANVHEGEEITPRPYVDSQRAARDETNDLLARLVASDAETRKKLDAALNELKDIKTSSARTMRVAEKTDATGTPPTRATL